MISSDQIAMLNNKALAIRIDSIRATSASKSGHPTSCLSAADIIAALYFHVLFYDYDNPKNPNNDRLILSKGHAIPVVYAALKNLGVISDEELLSLREVSSRLEGHPTPRFPYNEAATGSLGQGLSVGLGMALDAKRDGRGYKTYVMIGDGESAEGSIWEAAELAAVYELDNLIGILDCNRLGQSDETMYGHHAEKYKAKFEAFGWQVCVIDGHDMTAVAQALIIASGNSSKKPFMIIAKTFKGYGLEDIQNKEGFHGKPIPQDQLNDVIAKLRARFGQGDSDRAHAAHHQKKPALEHRSATVKISFDLEQDHRAFIAQGKKIATRKAFGYGLVALGRRSKDVVVLDADVKNSTYTELFEKEFPDRFVQCFIAEQNMVGVATGFELRGKIPFAATFGAFFTRSFDQIRMAGIGRNALRLSGSHSGVSIGEDGPSQMALEDLAMMRTVPNSIVLYPSDGLSAYKLTILAANYHDGISYIRTTRMDAPVLYAEHEEFPLGGCKVVRQGNNDVACIVAAGVTLHEALKACDMLAAQGIAVSVIDLYSVKPLDEKTVRSVALSSGRRIITVEDHYQAGGIGEAVTCAMQGSGIAVERMFVPGLSRSGSPEALMALAGIDAESICKRVKGQF